MSDIIGKWLTETLGIIVEVYSETFIRLVRNGYLIGALLRHYNIITAEHLTSLTAAGDSADCLDKIGVWLREVNIELDDETKKQLAKGKLSAGLDLLYRLYLVLQNKDPLHYTAKHLQTETIRSTNDRFYITPVVDETPDTGANTPHSLSNALDNYKHIVHWHGDRHCQLLKRCEEQRRKYEKLIAKRTKDYPITYSPVAQVQKKTSDGVPDEDVLSLSKNYEELLAQGKRAQQLESFKPDSNVTKDMVKKLKKKYNRERANVTFQSKMEAMVLAYFWDDLVATQRKDIESNILGKLLKQSYYEKLVTGKMFEIKEQKEIMAENRLEILKEIQKKKDFELVEQLLAKEKELGDERYRYYFERDRALDLHKKLYEEKQRLKMQRKLEICRNVLEDILDMAIICSQYKAMYEEEMPELVQGFDMATLFVSSQPIFDLVPNAEVIIEYEPTDDAEEELYLAEIDRHNAMDARNFEKYIKLEPPWTIEVHVPDYVERNILTEIDIGQNILGHIAFRLLLTKYPKPSPKPPPNIPKVHVAVCISSISDLTILPILKKLLSERQVQVIQMEDAINFCLGSYKGEITVEYPESQFVNETQEALAQAAARTKGKIDAKKHRRRKGEKSNKKKKTAADESLESFMVLPIQDKQMQTPRIFPCDELVLTPAAELGRLAYEILNLGEALNDKLLVQMFVEYLKTLKNIDGWCLINYPTNLEQISLLEEALTAKPVLLTIKEEMQDEKFTIGFDKTISDHGSGDSSDLKPIFCSTVFNENRWSMEVKPVVREESVQNLPKLNEGDSIEDIADLDYREVKQNNVIEDTNARFRVSRLLTNPDPPPVIEDYDCYLTAFIKMIQDIPSEADLQALDKAKLDDLNRFYQSQGCLYNLYYKVLDLATIKHLGKVIVGDYTVPPKTSVQIFGDTVLYLENDLNQYEPIPGKVAKSQAGGMKKEKPPKPIKKEGVDTTIEDKKSKKGKKDKEKKEKSSEKSGKKDKRKKKGTKGEGDGGEEPDVVILNVNKETQIPEPPPEIEDIEGIPEPEPMPGQVNWKYVDLPFPEFFQVVLATLWENLEEIYVCDFREIFFRWRIMWKNVMPYLTYVRHYMTDFIQRPDNKQVYLYNFQRAYNCIDEDMRNDDEVKAELHCRVHEFMEKMLEICDTRMRESEDERRKLIMQDWIMKQACELTDIDITAMQLEIDRCCDTLQLLNDYYVAMITKMPCAEDVLEKQFLNYLPLKENFEFQNFEEFSNFMRTLLTDIEQSSNDSLFTKFVANNYAESERIVLNYQNKSLNILSGMENYFQPKGKKNKPKKDTKAKAKGKLKFPKFSGPDQEVKDVGLKLIDEWRCAINGEYTRVCLRLRLIKCLGDIDLQAILSSSTKTFHGLYNKIRERYNREVDSIKECCNLLSRAIEEEVPIQPELVLTGDEFFINPDVRLFEDVLPESESMLRELERPGAFTIAQLSFISDILLNLAPSGIIPERAFVFLLQDLIVNNAEDGAPPLVPQLWEQLQSQNMNKLSYHFFGQVELIDWKDFIIYNLGVEFPNENELMQTRKQFREFDVDSKEYVCDYQFMTVRLWFEAQFDLTDSHEVFRLQEMKKLLFKLYSIDKELVNYTALLLAFCRDREPTMGLAKALQLSLGKFVCWDIETGEAFTAILRQRQLEQLQDKMRMEMEAAEKVETVEEVIDTLIDLAVDQCDSSYLESYCSAETTEHNVTQDDVVDLELLYLDHLMQYDDPLQNEENIPQYFLHEEYSDTEIYFEPKYYPSKVYYLVFEVLLAVMTAAMPWMTISKNDGEPSFRQILEDLYESCRNKEFERMVLMHEFLNSKGLKKLLQGNTKFVIKNPREIISELLEDI